MHLKKIIFLLFLLGTATSHVAFAQRVLYKDHEGNSMSARAFRKMLRSSDQIGYRWKVNEEGQRVQYIHPRYEYIRLEPSELDSIQRKIELLGQGIVDLSKTVGLFYVEPVGYVPKGQFVLELKAINDRENDFELFLLLGPDLQGRTNELQAIKDDGYFKKKFFNESFFGSGYIILKPTGEMFIQYSEGGYEFISTLASTEWEPEKDPIAFLFQRWY